MESTPLCTEHAIKINSLQKDMENCKKFEEKIDEISASLRILQDKSIVHSLVEKGIWFVVGIIVTIIVQNYFNAIATKEEENSYKIEKSK